MAGTFDDALEVQDVARALISEVEAHRWLSQYRIRYAFRVSDKIPYKGGIPVWGKSHVLSGLGKWLAGDLDAAVVVEKRAWGYLDTPRRRALVDHLLCHFAPTDDGGLSLCGPDVSEWASVIARHGMWRTELERMAEAMRPHQVPMDLDAPAPVEERDAEDEATAEADELTAPVEMKGYEAALAIAALRALPEYSPRADDEQWLRELHTEYPDTDLADAIQACGHHWASIDERTRAQSLNIHRAPSWRRRISLWLRRPAQGAPELETAGVAQ